MVEPPKKKKGKAKRKKPKGGSRAYVFSPPFTPYICLTAPSLIANKNAAMRVHSLKLADGRDICLHVAVAFLAEFVVDPQVKALRSSSEMIAVYQFLLIFDKSVGVKFEDKTPEVPPLRPLPRACSHIITR